MDIFDYCAGINKFHSFKKYFFTNDVFYNTLLLKTAKDNHISIWIYDVIDASTYQNEKSSYTILRIIFSMKKKDVDKLSNLLEKFHNSAMIMGYSDFEKASRDDISRLNLWRKEMSTKK